jgi:putative proteasome-type protease
MTYCVSILLDQGLVFLADSRTSAGVDQISTFRKLFVFERPDERLIVLMTAGNLAITQSMLSLLRDEISAPSAAGTPTLHSVPNLYEAARCVGDALRRVYERDAPALKEHGFEFSASFILGGQIRGERSRLFHIYAAGNFIEATPETLYFQIGESKYGKPIIDRIIEPSTSLRHAAKCALISMDSTIRSNLSVGLPLDLALYRNGDFRLALRLSIDSDDAYFGMIRGRWGDALRQAFSDLPDPPWN